MPMLGHAPWSANGEAPYIRRSMAVKQGLQVFWSSTGGPKNDGEIVAIDYLTIAHPELAGRFDTIVLNPLDYEAVKKSEMETPHKDSLRRDKRRGSGDLRGFDPVTRFRKAMEGSK